MPSTIRPAPSLAIETRDILRAYGLRPRKALGQNFLIDRDALHAVADAAELCPGDAVLEVGPGVGTLTGTLIARGGAVTAVELDESLSRVLAARTVLAGVRVVTGNILHLDLREVLPSDRPYKVVANIPYYITAPIVRLFLEAARPPELMVLMVQREVAERLTARPGRLSVLGVTAQFYAEVETVQLVPAAAFMPPPEVDSAIVRLRPRRVPVVPVDDAERFFALVKIGFGEKRKQLHNALARGIPHVPAAEIDAALAGTEIDRARRAETLSLDEWGALYQALGPRLGKRGA